MFSKKKKKRNRIKWWLPPLLLPLPLLLLLFFVTIIDCLTIACLFACLADWLVWHTKNQQLYRTSISNATTIGINCSSKKKSYMKWNGESSFTAEKTQIHVISSSHPLPLALSITCFQIFFFGFVFFACNNLAFILLFYWRYLMSAIKITTKCSFFCCFAKDQDIVVVASKQILQWKKKLRKVLQEIGSDRGEMPEIHSNVKTNNNEKFLKMPSGITFGNFFFYYKYNNNSREEERERVSFF